MFTLRFMLSPSWLHGVVCSSGASIFRGDLRKLPFSYSGVFRRPYIYVYKFCTPKHGSDSAAVMASPESPAVSVEDFDKIGTQHTYADAEILRP
jgi:hypothetical protein